MTHGLPAKIAIVVTSPFIDGFKLILASQSARRAALLTQAGFPFVVRPSEIPELRSPAESAFEYVSRLAEEKAAATSFDSGEGVLAADTTVVLMDCGTEFILEKPAGSADATAMIKALSGRQHSVLTAICFRWQDLQWLHVEETKVEFSELSDAEISEYVASGEPFDKAGSYGIQGLASRFIPRIEGCYFNVVGLPVHQVHRIFALAGVLAEV